MQDSSISSYSIKVIERLLASVTNTETGFLQTIDEAQAFMTDESTVETIQQEEDDALEAFTSAIQEVRDLAEELLAHKRLKLGLDTFQRDLQTLRKLITANPDRTQDSASQALEAQYSTLQRDWDTTELPPGHDLEEALHSGRELLTTLKAELEIHKDRSAGTPTILSSSFISRDSDRSDEGK